MLVHLRKAYFWFFVALNIVAIGSYAFYLDQEPMEITDYVSLITTPLGVIALFGYAYSKVFFRQWLWVGVVIIILANEVIYGFSYFVIAAYEEVQAGNIEISNLKYPVISLLLFVPYYIGITKYALNKKSWNTT